MGVSRSKNSIFRVLRCPSTILRTAYRKQFCPKPMVPMESRDSEGVPCLLLVSRVCDQTYGRYRPLKCVEKWSHDIMNLKICIQSHVEKFIDSKNAFFFDLRRKITQLLREKPFQNSGVTRRLAVLNWRSWSIHPSSLNMLGYSRRNPLANNVCRT